MYRKELGPLCVPTDPSRWARQADEGCADRAAEKGPGKGQEGGAEGAGPPRWCLQACRAQVGSGETAEEPSPGPGSPANSILVSGWTCGRGLQRERPPGHQVPIRSLLSPLQHLWEAPVLTPGPAHLSRGDKMLSPAGWRTDSKPNPREAGHAPPRGSSGPWSIGGSTGKWGGAAETQKAGECGQGGPGGTSAFGGWLRRDGGPPWGAQTQRRGGNPTKFLNDPPPICTMTAHQSLKTQFLPQ